MSNTEIDNVKDFSVYAANSLFRWQQILGKEVVHSNNRTGRIYSIRGAGKELSVLFEDQRIIKFEKDKFLHKFSSIIPSLSLDLLQEKEGKEKRKVEEERKLREEERVREEQIKEEQRISDFNTKKEFSRLKEKYCAESHQSLSCLDYLYQLLLKIDSQENLENNEISWLKQKKLYGTIAIYFQGIYEFTNNLWDLVQASRYWRDEGKPNRALEITNNITTSDTKLKSAILTTRGAALKDIGHLNKAESLAQEAICLTPKSHYPYNLMGAICYQLMRPSEGDKYFSEAITLGAGEQLQDNMRRKALGQMSSKERKIVAEHLLSLDRVRFAWVEEQ